MWPCHYCINLRPRYDNNINAVPTALDFSPKAFQSNSVQDIQIYFVLSFIPPRENCTPSLPGSPYKLQPASSLATSTCASSQTTRTCPTKPRNPLPNLRIRPHQLVPSISRLGPSLRSTTSIIIHICTTTTVERRNHSPRTLRMRVLVAKVKV
jgi:hypothetical protein